MSSKVKQSQVVRNSISVFSKHSVRLEKSRGELNNPHPEAGGEQASPYWSLAVCDCDLHFWWLTKPGKIWSVCLDSRCMVRYLNHTWFVSTREGGLIPNWTYLNWNVLVSCIEVRVTIPIRATWEEKMGTRSPAPQTLNPAFWISIKTGG